MLTSNSLDESIGLTGVIDEMGRFLAPVQNSPLDQLVRATRVQILDNKKVSKQCIASLVQFTSEEKDGNLEISHHDAALGEIRDQLAPIVRQQIKYIRSVVNPQIRHFAEMVEEYIKSGPVNDINQFEIKPIYAPKPLYAGLLDITQNYSNGTIRETPVLNLPNRTTDELIDLLQTMVPHLDKALADWFTSNPKLRQTVDTVWSFIFQSIRPKDGTDSTKFFTSKFFRSTDDTGLDCAIIAFLLAHKLYDNPPDGVTNMTLTSFNSAMSDIMLTTAAVITREYGTYEYVLNSKVLIAADAGPSNKTIFVYGENYDDWIKSGGTNEIIMATSLHRDHPSTVKTIEAEKDNLIQLWKDYVYSKRASYENNMVEHLLRGIKYAFEKISREIYANNPGDTVVGPIEATRLFNLEMSLIRQDELKDIQFLATRLVTRTWYAKTDAYQFALDMIEIAGYDENMNPEEVALLATHKYISRWVSSQIAVTDKLNLIRT